MKTLAIVLLALGMLALAIWLGLRVRPGPLPPFAGQEEAPAAARETMPLPDGLPAPVARFYRALYGDEVPVRTSAVISGRARMTIGGITFPARFRFVHDAGRAYRHYFELTWFGLPVMRVNERFVDGAARLELPVEVTEGEPKVDQAANLALWAESLWLPSVYLTDPRVSWEAVDERSAVLAVPWDGGEERLIVRFDEATGLPRFVESMRYRDAGSEAKSLWVNELLRWGQVDGRTVPVDAAVTWYEDGWPWAEFHVDSVVYDADVGEYVRARGR